MAGINSEMEQMKERFAKLLLGEDMSGGGKGVSSALALSNAFTNLAGKLTFFFFSILSIPIDFCNQQILQYDTPFFESFLS